METAHEEQHLRSVLGHFATGVAVVTGRDADSPVGMTIQSFCSLSLDPPLILLCPGLSSTSWPRIEPAGGICVNLLAEDQEDLARQFAKSGSDKFRGVEWTPSSTLGCPVLKDVLAWIESRVVAVHQGGDHLVVICRVLALGARTDLRPLIFFKSGFERMLDRYGHD